MSYDIYLVDPITSEILDVGFTHHLTGGTYCVGGTSAATLNITYNYADILHRVLPKFESTGYSGIRSIYGLTGAESILLLNQAISQLASDVSTDYWQATEGNVKSALLKVLALAQLRPDGIWTGD
jgi:hypothetical protein